MSSDTNETRADIIREMRTYFQTQKRNGNHEHRTWHQVLSDWADRIEAAAKREKDAAEAEALNVGGIVEATRHKIAQETDKNEQCAPPIAQERPQIEQPGDAAALREALMKIRDKCIIYNNELAEEIDALCGNALSAPSRNCDVYDAENGVAECMQAIDAAWHEVDTIRATIGWMLAPAEGGASA